MSRRPKFLFFLAIALTSMMAFVYGCEGEEEEPEATETPAETGTPGELSG
jgi:Na+-transporting methylmalonyl-CoA/oxaloacetate decarboxylase gamma subunit